MGSNNRKLILIVDNSVAVTGAFKAIVHAAGFLKKDFDFLFILPQSSFASAYLKEQGWPYRELPFVEISKKPGNLIRYFPYLIINGIRLKRIAAQSQASIIHVNDFYNLTGIFAKLAGAKVKLVTHVRFMPQRFVPALANTWANLNERFADQVICVSNAVRAFFAESEKVIVIPDPVPEKEIHPEKEVSGPRQDIIKLLYLSNFIQGKGQNFALEAFKQAYAGNPSLRLTFVGGDMGMEKNKQFRQQLEKEVQRSGLQEVVRFEGFAQDVEAAIKRADILLNFSESESFSLTCLDALYYGTPVIASDCGGPAELFEHGISGLLVPNRDVDRMAKAILALAEDPQLRIRFSQQGKKYVRRKFSLENSVFKLKEIYLRLLAN